MGAPRKVVLDTETTGLDVGQGHRVIEIGCIELQNRRTTGNDFHQYVNPQRMVDAGAQKIHGISDAFLSKKPFFGEIAEDLWNYLTGAELIIHNAAFDMGFLEMEFALVGHPQKLSDVCNVIDTVKMARAQHPGHKYSLDALCKRYSIDNSNRDHHGALLDARLLADVYLAMTSSQPQLALENASLEKDSERGDRLSEILIPKYGPVIITANEHELSKHKEYLHSIIEKLGEQKKKLEKEEVSLIAERGFLIAKIENNESPMSNTEVMQLTKKLQTAEDRIKEIEDLKKRYLIWESDLE